MMGKPSRAYPFTFGTASQEESVPWKTTSPMSLRLEFVHAVLAHRRSIRDACRGFGISERTGHKWLARFAHEGEAGLVDRPHTPHTCAHQLAPSLAEAILALRHEHPTWGPRKLRAYLGWKRPTIPWPAPSTIGGLLARHPPVRRGPRGGP